MVGSSLFDRLVLPDFPADGRYQRRQQSAQEVRDFAKQAHVTLLP